MQAETETNITMTTPKVQYLVINHEYKPEIGTTSSQIELNLIENVDDLRKKVKKEESIDIPASRLTVWRCSDPGVTLDNNNHTKLKAQVSKIFAGEVRKLDPREEISALEISEEETMFVQLPELTTRPSSSRKKLEVNELDNDERCIRLLCERYWGKGEEGWENILRTESITVPFFESHSDEARPLESETLSNAATSLLNHDPDGSDVSIPAANSSQQGSEVLYKYIHLDPEIKDFFPIPSDTMLVRAEYLQIVEHLTNLRKRGARGIVLTGRPGIGKTAFLFYLLISRILLGEPTAFQLDNLRTFLLKGRSDIRVFSKNERIDPVAYPDVWALTDSNADVITPRGELVDARSKFFVIQATLPDPVRWTSWSNQLSARLVVMNQWSWPEIYIAGMRFTRPGTSMDPKELWEVFIKTGGSVRQCHHLTCFPEELKRWEGGLSRRLKVMPELKVFKTLYEGPATYMNSDTLIKNIF